MGDVARLARARLAARRTDPIKTTGRGPIRSVRVPHAILANAMARNPMVMALDTLVTDQPVLFEMGRRKTGRENIAPMATQPSKPPAATITQR
jgi:hypothetical protein